MPPCPVIVNERVVVEADSFVAIVALDICEQVTFPATVRSTVLPVFVVATTVDGNGLVDGGVVEVGVAV